MGLPGERTFGGWAVSATAHRETETKYQVRTRPFTVVTHERADAEQYAYDEMAKDFPPDQGWAIIVSAMPLWWLPCEV